MCGNRIIYYSMEQIHREQEDFQRLFYSWVSGLEGTRANCPSSGRLHDELVAAVKKYHNHQWSTKGKIHNIIDVHTNCANDCVYCYMKSLKHRFHATDIEDFTMGLSERAVAKRWRKATDARRALIMFPSSHDIFPEFVEAYATVALAMIEAGHDVLVVTKPRVECIEYLAEQFSEHKDKVIFRLTITSDDPDVLALWEPRVPKLNERLDCLRLLYGRGFLTSVSIEPYLTDPTPLLALIDEFVNETIFIGEMSGLEQARSRGIDDGEIRRISALYTKDCTLAVIRRHQDNPKIRWKTSVMKRAMKSR